jgi:glutamine amidotransferase PdxT
MSNSEVIIGVLALQGAFEEHQECIEKSTGCKTIQVRKKMYSLSAEIDILVFLHRC